MFLSTALFFIFFGQLCVAQHRGIEPIPKSGVKTFCVKMTSQIMRTGLGILGLLLIVAVTSFIRNRIPYEARLPMLHH